MQPNPEGLSDNGMAVLAIVVWASIIWVGETMSVGITGISVPNLLILTEGISYVNGKPPMDIVFSGFTQHVVWLCLFSFFVGAIMQFIKLDRRTALGILDRINASNVGRVIWGMFFVNIVFAFLIPAANARAATLLPVVKGLTKYTGCWSWPLVRLSGYSRLGRFRTLAFLETEPFNIFEGYYHG